MHSLVSSRRSRPLVKLDQLNERIRTEECLPVQLPHQLVLDSSDVSLLLPLHAIVLFAGVANE